MKHVNLTLIAIAVMALTAFLGEGTADATELYRNTTPNANDTLSAGTEFAGSVEAGGSVSLRFTDNTLFETCTGSELKGSTEGKAVGLTVTAGLTSLTYAGCNHKATTLKPGKLHFEWTSGTNAMVRSGATELTIYSTLFGMSCIAKTGEGTTIGTLTGANTSSSYAIIDVNGVIPMGGCGDANLTGSYKITSPKGLVVEQEQEPEPITTELYKNTSPEPNDTFGASTELTASLSSGTSLVLKDTNGLTVDTCSGSEIKGTTEKASGTTVTLPLPSLAFSGCSHKTTVLKPGKLHIEWLSGTTNGTLRSSEAEVTVVSTVFGISCIIKTGAGTTLGTVTGAKSGSEHAMIDVNGVVAMGGCGDANLTGSYKITSPTGLVVDQEQEPEPITTELYKNTAPEPNDTLGAGTELTASIVAGGSSILKDTNGLTVDTCKSSELKAKTENPTGATVTAPVSSLSLTGCSHKTTVIKPGKLHITWVSGMTNGTLSSSEAEVTVESTIFGITCIAKTGSGTVLGTLTGAKASSEHAMIDVNGVVAMGGCGDAILTGSYRVTGPTGLVVEKG